MLSLIQDLKYGLRRLVQRPGFAIVAIGTLALGIGANTAIFSVVNGVLLRSLPYQDPDRIMLLWEAGGGVRTTPVSVANFLDWREQQKSFEAISAYSGRWGGPETVIGGSQPERAHVVGVFNDYFRVLGVQPLVGRVFINDEDKAGSAPVVVVSHAFWQRSLGGVQQLDKCRLRIGSGSYQVIGVMPPQFAYPAETDLWTSMEQFDGERGSRSSHGFIGIGKLRDGVTHQQAQAEMTQIAGRIVQNDRTDEAHNDVAVVSIKDQLTGPIRQALILLFGAVACVLLIACGNVANLFLARAVGRQREMAIRAALGAGRARIIRQLLTESLILGLAGGAVGLLLAYWMVGALVSFGPSTIPRLNEIQIDGKTLLFTLVVSLLTSIIFGLFPALRASKPDLNQSLKESGRNTAGNSGWVRSGLVVGEIALTLMLLLGAGLLTRSLLRVLDVSPGFDATNVQTMQISLPELDYADPQRRVNFYRQLLERIRAVPGVESAGLINNLPMGGVDLNGQFGIAGRPPEKFGYGGYRVVDTDYFKSLHIPLIKGRYFAAGDTESTERVALISQRVADTFFRGEDPIGQRVLSVNDISSREEISRPEEWPKVVGVVGDVRHFGLERRTSADLYFNYVQRSQRIGGMTATVRTSGQNLTNALRDAVKDIDPNLPVQMRALDDTLGNSTANRRFNVVLLGAFAGLALLLATIGIYSVTSYTVSQNTREIGIRRALGAQASDVLRLVLGQGAVLALTGIGIGLAASLALGRFVGSLLYGVKATDPLTYIAVAVVLLAVALLACYMPARKAARIDPMVALRHE